jgi:hypothetical protein
LIKACCVTSFGLLQLQSSGISLTQRLGTHFEYRLVTSCHTSHLRGVNRQEAARANMAKAAATEKNRQVSEYPGRESEHMGEGPRRGPPRRAVPTNIANGARLLTGRTRPTIPQSVVGSTRTAARRTGLLSPSIPRRSPGRNQEAGMPIR